MSCGVAADREAVRAAAGCGAARSRPRGCDFLRLRFLSYYRCRDDRAAAISREHGGDGAFSQPNLHHRPLVRFLVHILLCPFVQY